MADVKNEKIYAVLFFSFAIVLSLTVGELAIRLISDRVLIYNIEMLKYAEQLKQPDPLKEITHVHKKSSSAELMGVRVNLNSNGNRSRELSDRKLEDEKRIYVAGSSVTMGWGVSEENVFTRLAEDRLNLEGQYKYSVINAGVGNYGARSYITILYRDFEKIMPDLVVLHYFVADVEPRKKANDSVLLEKSYLAAYLYNDLRGYQFKREHGSLFNFYNNLYAEDSSSWTETKNDIRELKKLLDSKNVPLVIMIMPDINNLSEASPFQSIYLKVAAAFADMNIATVNMYYNFQSQFKNKEPELWVHKNDPHPNSKGHQLMADVLYDIIRKSLEKDSRR